MNILLIEDNEGDILLTREALESGKLTSNIEVLKNGELAIKYLTDLITQPVKNFPHIILLDINLPKNNGQEVLRFIKGNDALKQIPVIMLTTSSSEKDIMTSYLNQANCFIMKPVDINSFIEIIMKIEEFWGSIVCLPVFEK